MPPSILVLTPGDGWLPHAVAAADLPADPPAPAVTRAAAAAPPVAAGGGAGEEREGDVAVSPVPHVYQDSNHSILISDSAVADHLAAASLGKPGMGGVLALFSRLEAAAFYCLEITGDSTSEVRLFDNVLSLHLLGRFLDAGKSLAQRKIHDQTICLQHAKSRKVFTPKIRSHITFDHRH